MGRCGLHQPADLLEDKEKEGRVVGIRLDTDDRRVDRSPQKHRTTAVNEWVFIQPKGQHQGKPYTENRGFPQTLCDKAEVKRFGCHGIRGLTASILAKHDVPMIYIRDTLRHKNLRITERYVRWIGFCERTSHGP